MATGDITASGTYRPESAQSKRAIHTPGEELWELKTRARVAAEPRDKFMALKQLCALIYSKFGEMVRGSGPPKGFAQSTWDADWTEIQRIFKEATEYRVEIPALPAVEPIAFRFGLPQYEIVGTNNEVLSTVYANEVKSVLESHNKRDTENVLWSAVDHLIYLEGQLELYLVKYRIYDSATRIQFEETGYNRDVRDQRLGAFKSIGEDEHSREREE
jgi:hypothetical protein